MENPPKKHTPSKIIAWITGTLTTITGIFWAVITYVFPDPSILGLGFVNWKNFLSFCAAFVFLGAIIVALQARNLHTAARGAISLILAAGLSASFFVIGMEYAKPSFEFAQRQERSIENDSPTLMGKRIVMIEGVRVDLLGCQIVAQSPSCLLELTSTNKDRKIGFDRKSSLFEPNGSSLKIDRILVGNQSLKTYSDIELIRNLSTKITITFEPTQVILSSIPSIKLLMDGFDNHDQSIKFNDVPLL